MPTVHNFRIIIEQDEDSLFVAEVPAIPGCFTQAKTYEQAIKRVTEAIELCLKEAKSDPDYKAKINFDQPSGNRFLGVADVSVNVNF